jgi:hypothetical protein
VRPLAHAWSQLSPAHRREAACPAPGRLSYPAVMMFRPVEKCDQSSVSTMAASIEGAAACVTEKRIGWRSETRRTQSRHECRMHHQSAEHVATIAGELDRRGKQARTSRNISPLPVRYRATVRGRSARPLLSPLLFRKPKPVSADFVILDKFDSSLLQGCLYPD